MATSIARQNPFVALGQLRPELMGITFHIAWLFLLMYHAPALSEMSMYGTPISLFYFVSFCSLVCVSLAFIAAPKQLLDVFYCRSGVMVAGLTTLIGTALYCAAQITKSMPALIGAGVITGMGSCVIASLWAVVFARMTPGQTCANLPFILCVVTVTCVDICFVPMELYYVAVITLALSNVIALDYSVASLGKGNLSVALKPGTSEHSRIKPASGLAVFVVFIATIGLLEGILSAIPTGSILFFEDTESLFYFITNIIVFIALGAFIKETRPEGLIALFAVPILAILTFLVPVMCIGTQTASDTFYNVGLVSQELVLVAGTVALAISFNMPPIRTFLIARVAFGLSDIAGGLIAAFVLGDAVSEIMGVVVFALCEAVVALMIFIFVVLHRFNTTHDDDEGKQKRQSDNIQIRDACERIADACKLSPRERDVFFLLAEGRSTARVKEELCIAEGTVNTHVRNIYSKLGVHTRQEMLDVVYGKNDG